MGNFHHLSPIIGRYHNLTYQVTMLEVFTLIVSVEESFFDLVPDGRIPDATLHSFAFGQLPVFLECRVIVLLGLQTRTGDGFYIGHYERFGGFILPGCPGLGSGDGGSYLLIPVVHCLLGQRWILLTYYCWHATGPYNVSD